jgi:hypothetical protein
VKQRPRPLCTQTCAVRRFACRIVR